MNNGNTDLATMLDELNLPLAAERLTEILNSPELGNYSPQQFLREVIEASVYRKHEQAFHNQPAAQQTH